MTLHVTDIAARERRFVGTLWFARRTRMTGFTCLWRTSVTVVSTALPKK